MTDKSGDALRVSDKQDLVELHGKNGTEYTQTRNHDQSSPVPILRRQADDGHGLRSKSIGQFVR